MIPQLQMRSEYCKLGLDLAELARNFGHPLTRNEARDGYLLALAMDHVDDAIDAIVEAEPRLQLCDQVLAFLDGAESCPENLAEILHCIREVAEARQRLHHFRDRVAALMDIGEQLRLESSPSGYIDLSLEEARRTIELLFSLLPELPTRLSDFLCWSGEIGNVSDKILDLGEDRREGRTLVQPSAALYLYYLRRIVPVGWRLLWLHPNKVAFASWTVSYLRFGTLYVSGRIPSHADARLSWERGRPCS